MAWWGIAYASGLHINNPEMSAKQSRRAYEAAQEALRHLDHAAPVEAALARSVAERYAWPVPEDRKPLDEAYAAAMQRTYEAFPDDPDVGALYAESLMDLQPWDLWTKEGEPKGRTLEIVDVLERTIRLWPSHPGANHFYIHTVEASKDPARAVASADRLVDLVPGAGHLVHMPAHIYTRVGRYADASDANERAIAADQRYFALAPKPDFYSLYYVHNVHFLAYAAMMEGRYETAIGAARQLEQDVPQDFLREYVHYADGLMATPLHVLIRFGKWQEILQEPDYPAFRLLSRAQRRYARAVALAALGRPAEAREEMAAFEEIAAQVPEEWVVGNNPSKEVLDLCRHMMLGEILFREGRLDEAFAALAKGAELEDDLVYDEPPGWMQPVRHAWGALLMSAGRYADAERVYREDLEHNPQNGWSLLGLEQAQRAQREDEAAARTAVALEAAWPRADVKPTSSCYCEPGERRAD
jgi:tetratricopeptide (TPR) repeat protein